MQTNKMKNGAGDAGKSGSRCVSIRTRVGIDIALGCVAAGVLFCALYAWQAPSLVQTLSILGVAAILGGAALLVGALLGFLFGIPKTLQREVPSGTPQSPPGIEAQQGQPTISHEPNTNLEQISDWLTKILVGVGLTQLTSIPSGLQRYAAYAAPSLGDFPSSPLFASALLVYFSVCGFLIGYLCTRLYLAGAIGRADIDVIGGQLAEVQDKVGEMQDQAQKDAEALRLAESVLNAETGKLLVSPEELNEAVCAASASMKARVFFEAREVRSQNWKDLKDKPKMEQTIPIFKALIACDTEDGHHIYHGQLGFALKDARQPQWSEAEKELTKAIELRGSWEKSDWPPMYEFNRAVCRINMGETFTLNKGSAESAKEAILADLKAALQRGLGKLIGEEAVIGQWMKLNDIPLDEPGAASHAPDPPGA
jgi:hypothetical protein